MLPDFPELKKIVLEQAFGFMRQQVLKRHPILNEIKSYTQHEGRALRIEQVDFGEKRQELETHQIPIELKIDEIPTLVGRKLLDKLEKLADDLAERQIKTLLARHEEATLLTGNRIDAGGRPMDGALLLEFLSGMPIDFDSKGNIVPTNTVLTHPDMMKTYKAAIDEIENDSVLQSKHRDAIAEQFKQWVDRENRRTLVD